MGDGEASVYGHSWTTQSFANDYNERNAPSRSDSTEAIAPAYLPQVPRINTSAIFGPRGELIDELQRRGKSFACTSSR